MFRHGKHEGSGVKRAGDKPAGSPVKAEGIPGREEEAQQHLEAAHGWSNLGHDEDEAFSRRRGVRMDSDMALDLEQRGRIDQRFSLRVDGVGRMCVGDRGDWLGFLLLLAILARVVEFDIALENWHRRAVVWRSLLELLLELGVLFLVRR